MKHFRPFIAVVILTILSTTPPFAQESSCDSSLLSYCSPGTDTLFPCKSDPYITRVRIGDINNVTECAKYSCFMDMSSTVEAGTSYNLSVHVTAHSVPGYCLSIKYYIDWNEDGDFDDPDEGLWGDRNGGPPPYSWSVAVAVPDEVTPGEKRMRIRVFEECVLPIDPDACDWSYYGEVEDYTLVVSDPLTSLESVTAGQEVQLSIYPNPAVDNITISGIPHPATGEVVLTSFNGAVVFQQNGIISDQMSIGIANVDEGIYVVEVRTQGYVGREKILIVR